MTDDKNRSDLDIIIEKIKRELRNLLIKRKELITKLGNAFERVVADPESVCEEIKNCLREEIRDKIISARDIERYCPDKWKKKTKPKNDNLSFSKQVEENPKQRIAPTQDGKSFIANETSSNADASDGVNHIHDQPKQDGISIDDNNEAQTTVTNQGELVSYNEPKDSTVSAGDSTSQDVNKLSLDPSDIQDCAQCVQFRIPREKYGIVRDAMDNSKASIFIKFDRNKNFLDADPDVCNETAFANSKANNQDINVTNSVRRCSRGQTS